MPLPAYSPLADTYSKDVNSGNPYQFHFQVTGPRACNGGDYMLTPERVAYCSQFTPDQLACANCIHGYNGTSVPFVYTPMSNGQWPNEM